MEVRIGGAAYGGRAGVELVSETAGFADSARGDSRRLGASGRVASRGSTCESSESYGCCASVLSGGDTTSLGAEVAAASSSCGVGRSLGSACSVAPAGGASSMTGGSDTKIVWVPDDRGPLAQGAATGGAGGKEKDCWEASGSSVSPSWSTARREVAVRG